MSDRHGLELKGYNALLAEHCELVDRVAAQQQQIEALKLSVSKLVAWIGESQRGRFESAQELVADLSAG